MCAKTELQLCMGSACHQYGVYQVLPELQRLLREHGLDESVELKGAFCLGAVYRRRGDEVRRPPVHRH